MAKPLLVRISHAVERFALASDRDYPLAVVALFQRMSYFEREADVYARIGAHAALTVVGVVDPPPATTGGRGPDTPGGAGPPGVVFVRLGEETALAREWTVVVLSPRSGAVLVATDLESLDPDARSLEAGRLFGASWSFHRADAYAELVRLRAALGPALPTARLRVVDDVLTQVIALPGTDRDDRTDAAFQHLVDDLYRIQRQRDVLARRVDDLDPRSSEQDPRTGLHTAEFLSRWCDRSATGTLTVGLAVVRLHEMGEVRDHYGFRAELALTQSIGRLLRRAGAGADRAVRLSSSEFVVVMPTRAVDHMLAVAEQLQRGLQDLAGGYPFVSVPATVAVTATRVRPLPVDPLRAAARRDRRPIVTI